MRRRVAEPRLLGLTPEKRELLYDRRHEEHALNRCDIPDCPYGCNVEYADTTDREADKRISGYLIGLAILFTIGVLVSFGFRH